jgi:tetratricopeptide (TPR) repeat protein
MQIIRLTKAAAFALLTFTLSATPVWSQTNRNSFKETPILYSQSQSNRDLAIIQNNRGVDYAGQQKWDLAVADFNRAIALNPNHAEAYNLRGNVYANQEKWNLAVADYTQVIRLNPNHAKAYNLRGIVYDNQQKWDLAVGDYTQAIRLNPNYAEAYNLRGFVYYKLGDINKARQDFQRAAQLYRTQGRTADYERVITLLNLL